MARRCCLILLAGLLMVGCDQPPAPAPAGHAAGTRVSHAGSTPRSAPTHPTRRFRSTRLGFVIDYPTGMHASTRFDSQYLASDAWKTYAPAGTKGKAVLMLTLPGSNRVTAGELRIGVSRHADARRRCDQPPASVRPATRGHTTVNGTAFTTWHAADAAMSHYLKVHSYRTVHDGYCYAIDLLVTGTNPQVYSPPKTPPFSEQQAFAQLHDALQGFRFTR